MLWVSMCVRRKVSETTSTVGIKRKDHKSCDGEADGGIKGHILQLLCRS